MDRKTPLRNAVFGRWLARRAVTLGLLGALALGMTMPHDADARRLGGGQSIGRQSGTAPSPSGPGQHAPQAQAGRQAAQTPPPAAAQARNRWMGPLAGLAAGFGIAALLSHFGLGEGLAQMMSNMLLIGAVVFLGMMLLRFITRRNRPASAAARDLVDPLVPAAGSAADSGMSARRASAELRQSAAPVPQSRWASPAQGATNAWQPHDASAGFDETAFLPQARAMFVRLQKAWDDRDQADLFEFTTPDMFAHVKADLDARGARANRTVVAQLDAELLGVEDHGDTMLARVRFHGRMQEAENESAQPFEEVWNIVGGPGRHEPWRLAGIEQVA
jgi:predicted lipid-binding transport protein (Tim44 family)